MKDALLIAAVVGGAYLLLRDRRENLSEEDRTLQRITSGFTSGFKLAKEGKSLLTDIFGGDIHF